MLNFRLLIVLLISISLKSCSVEGDTSIQIVDVSSCKEYPIHEIFDSLEVISLEAHPDALVGALPRLLDCQDYYVIEQYPNFYIFEKNGAFASCTKKILGHGKGEVPYLIGCSFNPYSKLIEILSFGKMLKYDIHLNFVSQHPLPCDMGNRKNPNKNSGSWFNCIYDLSATDHILIPGGGLMNSNYIYLFNSEKNEITWKSSFENEILNPIGSWQSDRFCKDNSKIYVFPDYLMKRFCMYDEETKSLVPYLELDFGSNGLTKDLINQHSSDDYIENQRKICEYLMCDCDKHYPIRSAVTYNKLFTLVHTSIKTHDWYLLVVDLTDYTIKRLNIANDKKEIFAIDFTASDGYVYTVDNDEDRVRQCISAFKNRDRVKYSGISDTLDCSNAVILKYKVK